MKKLTHNPQPPCTCALTLPKMGKELKCGNKICWVIFTVIFFILAIVGISFVTNPADSFDYGCGGGGGKSCSKNCGADEMEGENFCSDYTEECAGPETAW